MIVPRHVVARSQTGSKRPHHARLIGVGSMGTGPRSWIPQNAGRPVLAICDVRQAHLERAKTAVDQQYGDKACLRITDFRELLARTDIDAVVIAPGERWHPLIGIEAARRGKHMYLREAAQRDAGGRLGTARSGEEVRCRLPVRHAAAVQPQLPPHGGVGPERPHRRCADIMIGSAGGGTPKPENPETLKDPPPGFDYDKWLGPAPYIPYSDVRVSRTWMFIRDYGLGCLGGAWGIHDVDAAQFFLDTDDTTPIEIEGRARYYEDIRDVPYSWTVEQKYATGAVVIHMDLVTAKTRAKQFEFGGMASLVTGSKGWIWVSRQGMRTEPESLSRRSSGRTRSASCSRTTTSGTSSTPFVKATAHLAHRPAVHAETMVQQADIAMQLQRKLRWDPKVERFIDDEQANRMLSRAIRAPWTYTT